MPPWPDSVAALHLLRSRYVIARLSNGHVALLIRMAKAAGLPGCAPAQVMLVASHPSDLAAAAKCGLQTCYVSRPLEYGEGRVVEATPAQGQFNLMVENLNGLATVMEC